MSDISIEADAFGRTLEQLLGRVDANTKAVMPEAVEKALTIGEAEWKKNAKAVLSKSYSRGGWGRVKSVEMYSDRGRRAGQVKKVNWYGRTYTTGKYARSIKHHMLSEGGDLTMGEVGSATLPGLAHLLEKGHAMVGGGSVAGREHIAPAAEEAFKDFEKLVDEAVEEAISEA